jgi:hypothetical protein
LERLRYSTEAGDEVVIAIGVEHGAFKPEIRRGIDSHGAAYEPGVDAVQRNVDRPDGRVVADLAVERQHPPIQLSFEADQSVTD